MSEFAGAYGDKRRAAAMARLYDAVVERNSLVIRKLGVDRRGELAAHRVLSSPRVTPIETLGCLTSATARAVSGRRIVAVQDTTEVNFPGRQSRGLGPAGNRGHRQQSAPGFFIHATVAVDADEDAVLGLVDAEIWTRETAPPTARRERILGEKESQRWLKAAQTVADRLRAASDIIVVGDRESDIYALFSRRPANVQLLVRCAQNRALGDGTLLFDIAAGWPALGERIVQVPPRGPGDRGREARVVLRAGRVVLRHPRNARREGDASSLEITMVEALEIDPPAGAAPLHWRLLTTTPAANEAAAADVVRLYRLRWRIEQTFRMLKTHGLCIEDVQTAEPHRLFNLAALQPVLRCASFNLSMPATAVHARPATWQQPTKSPPRPRCAPVWRARPTVNAIPMRSARSPGSVGPSPGSAAGTATTNPQAPKPCATGGSDSQQSLKASHSPMHHKMCESRSRP